MITRRPSSEHGFFDLGAVGPYELLVQLARGGSAEVFIARRACAAGGGDAGGAAGAGGAGPERESLVAVKRIRADLRYESSYACMLFDEAGIAVARREPHFVPVLGYGLDEGAPYIVMELVVGVTLKHLTRAPEVLGVGDAIELIAQAAEGLHAAHEARDSSGELLQVIHRDISPSNIFVGVDGRASICDLGLAYALRRTTRTKTGMVKEAELFLAGAGEREAAGSALGRVLLGVVAWRCWRAGGCSPAATMVSTLHAVLEREVPPLSSEREGVGQAVTAAVARAIERDRDARWPTAADFAQALRAAAGEEGHAASCDAIGARVAEVLPAAAEAARVVLRLGRAVRPEEIIAALAVDARGGAGGRGGVGRAPGTAAALARLSPLLRFRRPRGSPEPGYALNTTTRRITPSMQRGRGRLVVVVVVVYDTVKRERSAALLGRRRAAERRSETFTAEPSTTTTTTTTTTTSNVDADVNVDVDVDVHGRGYSC